MPSSSRHDQRFRTGLATALVSAATFGTSGPVATPLLRLGWSPGAVVLVRIGVAALLLAIPAFFVLRRWRPDRRMLAQIAAYGLIPIAGSQLCFFSAVQYLSAGVALLLEYLAPVLLIGYRWLRTGRSPRPAVLVGAAIALIGMSAVLDLIGGHQHVSLVGVGWGLAAALCLACYFVLSETSDEGAPLPALAMTAGGTLVGALAIGLAGLAGVLPMTFRTGTVHLASADLPWWLPAASLVLVSTVASYLAGIASIRHLGSQRASFIALTEVLFAIIAAIVLLAQVPGPTQLIGGVVVLAGILLVQRSQADVVQPSEAVVPVG